MMKNRTPLISAIALVLLAAGIVGSLMFRKSRVAPPDTTSTSSATVQPLTPAQTAFVAEAEAAEPVSPPVQQEEIVGIGAILKKDSGTGEIQIMGVVPNSPAAAAGLAGNFIIRKIDDAGVEGMGIQECVNLLRGPAGSMVRLELFDPDANETRSVVLTRQRFSVPAEQQMRRIK
jgi:C-terminal processing protease CtpA/Prc